MRLRVLVVAASLMAYAVPALAQRGVEVRDHGKKKAPDRVEVQARPAEAKVTGFSPGTGPVGTVVTITGDNFRPQTKVKVGGKPVKNIATTQTSITFAFPGRYRDSVITLHHPGMGNEIQVGTFMVQVDPRIAAFAPNSGPIGTRVEITGEGFLNGDRVLFNGKPLGAPEFGPNRIVVVIPPGATTDAFTISRPSNNYANTSRQKFQVVLPAPTVSSISPTSGGPGTQVRISGSYFAADDRVWYGPNQQADIVARADGWIDVRVPQNARQSQPFLIKGSHGAAQTPVFVLMLNPNIGRFSPDYGSAGTRVEIYGSNFAQSDLVYFNGKPLKIVAYDDNKLTVEIPNGASTDRFAIWRGGQVAGTARKPFEVLSGPTIASFSPSQGAAGTKVTIRGTGFTDGARVTYGAQQLRIVARRGDSEVDVLAPNGAGNQPFTVITRGGSVSSATAFQVVEYSAISGISPDRGPTGTRVTITIDHYSNSDQFWLNGVSLPIVDRGQGKYVVQIPANATTGRVEWETYGKRQTSNYTFTVLQPATITTFAPDHGPVGTRVTVKVTGYTGDEKFWLNGMVLPVTSRSQGAYALQIPVGATSGKVEWEVNGKRQPTNYSFAVDAATITTFAPDHGPVGTRVTVKVSAYTGNEKFWLNGVVLPITSKSQGAYALKIPEGASSGKVEWEIYGQRQPTNYTFNVDAATINTFAPDHGPVGTRVTVKVSAYTGNEKFWLNGVVLPITSRSQGAYALQIPDGASSGRVEWEIYGQRLPTNYTFTVEGAEITSFSPDRGPVGTRVTVKVSNYTGNEKFWLNGVVLPITSKSQGAYALQIPAGASSGKIEWEAHGQRSATRYTFTVDGPPAPPPPPPPAPTPAACNFTVSPGSVGAGQNVNIDISGCNVKSVSKAWFKAQPATIVSVSATTVVVKLPAKVSGTDYVSIETDDGKGVAVRQRTSNKITVSGY